MTPEIDKATARPWKVVDRRDAPLPNIVIVGTDGSHVAQAEGVHMRDRMVRYPRGEADAADARALANAALIVEAVNSYDHLRSQNQKLREACEAAQSELENLHEWINGVNIKGLVLDYRYEDRQRVMIKIREILAGRKSPLIAALEQLANNNLNDSNCASVEIAAKRVRNIARAALKEVE